MMILPIIVVGISLSPSDSSFCVMRVTNCSICSGSTGRLRRASCTERISLSRSKMRRSPFFLSTVNSRSCTRSNVVKRELHSGQKRRRRMVRPSSLGRESFTCVSAWPQNGHFINHSFLLSSRTCCGIQSTTLRPPRVSLGSSPAQGGDNVKRFIGGPPFSEICRKPRRRHCQPAGW